MRRSTKGWLKAAVITFGVVDCVGIYVAQNRLAQPVPTDMGIGRAEPPRRARIGRED